MLCCIPHVLKVFEHVFQTKTKHLHDITNCR